MKQFTTRGKIRLRLRVENFTCIFAEKLVAKSRKFNTNRSFWLYLNVDITERYDAADMISKKTNILPLENLGWKRANTGILEKFEELFNFIIKL